MFLPTHLIKANLIFRYKNEGYKIILFWTLLQNSRYDWMDSESPNEFRRLECPYKCVTTFDKNLHHNSDSLLFSLYDMKISLGLHPLITKILNVISFGFFTDSFEGFPTIKPVNQLWSLFWMEPPNILFRYVDKSAILNRLNDKIDITISYRSDSEIVRPYKYLIRNNRQDTKQIYKLSLF